jgi:hypothetical protein
MAVPDHSTLSAEQFGEILLAARESTIVNWGKDPVALERFKIPSYDKFIGSRQTDIALRGEYKVQVKGNRGGALQAYSGLDLLTNFGNYATSFDLTYGVGNIHLGDSISVQELEEAGVPVDLTRGTSEGRMPVRLDSAAKLASKNFAKQKQEDLEWNWRVELAYGMWSANANDSKMFPGLDGLIPVTTNSTGTIGGKSRSNPLLRHQLITGVTIDTLELNLTRLVRQCNDVTGDAGGYTNYCPTGDDVFDMLADLYLGTSTRAGKIDRQMASDRAKEMAAKWGIGIPDDSWYLPTVGMIIREPLFKRLQEREAPATSWTKRLYALNTSVMDFYGPRHAEYIYHPMPHNQRVLRTSLEGRYGWVIKKPNSLGVLALA